MRCTTSVALLVASIGLVCCTPARLPEQPVQLTSVQVTREKPQREFLETEKPLPEVPLPQWSATYRDAAHELGEWKTDYPKGAIKMARWGETHPEQFYTLVTWSMTHPYEKLDAMFATRVGWTDLRDIENEEPDAVAEFIDWCRRSPPGAVSLAQHPAGLAWLNAHGYQARSPAVVTR